MKFFYVFLILPDGTGFYHFHGRTFFVNILVLLNVLSALCMYHRFLNHYSLSMTRNCCLVEDPFYVPVRKRMLHQHLYWITRG